MNAPDNTGLNLFDDTASAAGNFPTALRGYDRSSVDEYIRTIENRFVEARRQAEALEVQLDEARTELDELRRLAEPQPEPDFGGLGGRATDLLRVSEEQAKEIVEKAKLDADGLREQGRRDADQIRAEGERDANDMRVAASTELEALRERLNTEVGSQVERARAEAETLLSAAHREAEMIRVQTEQANRSSVEKARLAARAVRQQAETEAAQIRQTSAAEHQAATAELERLHAEADTATKALLAQANEHHQKARAQLEADTASAAKIRSDALAEAEQAKMRAARETERQIEVAKRQAAAIQQRSDEQFAWRKEQLRKETELLSQRKAAILAQLASLSDLAQQSAVGLGGLDDPGNEADPEQFTAVAEEARDAIDQASDADEDTPDGDTTDGDTTDANTTDENTTGTTADGTTPAPETAPAAADESETPTIIRPREEAAATEDTEPATEETATEETATEKTAVLPAIEDDDITDTQVIGAVGPRGNGQQRR